MLSRNIVFTGKDQVEFVKEPVRDPGSGEVMLKARKTLISTGTEGICLSRLFEPGSHWDHWVTYPFYPGYLMVGEVVAVGLDVDQIHEGDRFGARRPHGEYVTVATSDLYAVPDGIADEDAPWFGLATIVQNGVRRAEHTLGEVVVVIGLGPDYPSLLTSRCAGGLSYVARGACHCDGCSFRLDTAVERTQNPCTCAMRPSQRALGLTVRSCLRRSTAMSPKVGR